MLFAECVCSGSSDGEGFASSEGDPGLTPGSGGSPEEGNGNPLQYSCLENPMDRGALAGYSQQARRVGHDQAHMLYAE